MADRTLDWRGDLGRWLKPFLARLGHKARRQMCPLYVSGLIGPGDRKSIQPMAKRLALGACDQLHHFIAAGVWDAGPLETELLVQADKLVGGSDAVLVIDDTAMPKKGTHSVGVAAQYASALGKTANCQTLVSLTLARDEVPVVLALRLFLPESWTRERARLERASVPAEYRTARTKPELALAEIDRVIAAGVHFGCVLADAGYGLSAPFRQALTARKLAWAVGIPRHLKVYSADVQMVWPVAKRGRPRQRHVPDVLSIPAEDMLAHAKWHTISWRTGTKGKLKARFAAVRVRVADGPPQRIRDKGQQHLPGEEAWLVGEHRASGEKKYYLANLPAKADLRTLAATIKARWICEQAHQQLKEELGLDHFEGRSWQGATVTALKRFFIWLAGQPGYKSRISYSDAEYFNLSAKETRIAKASRPARIPTLEQIRHVMQSMPAGTDIGRRDRALVAFTILTGARDGAIASLKLRHIDIAHGKIDQDARDVQTKFSKSFVTTFFPVGDDIRAVVVEWVTYLRREKLWGLDDPLFPATKIVVGENLRFEAGGLERKHWSSASPIRAIFKTAFAASDLPYFNPHSFRKTLALLGGRICRTPEEYKAWSQNLGHDHVMTTFSSYGDVGSYRQAEIIRGFSERGGGSPPGAFRF